MKNRLLRFWSLKPLGFIKFLEIFSVVSIITIYEKISSFLWKYNLGKTGNNLFIQKGASIRFPRNLTLGNNVFIGRGVDIYTEFSDSKLNIGNNSQINKGVVVDFSGNLTIGDYVVISEHASIMSHDHGLNPMSKPKKIVKFISDRVWIGAHAIILPQVSFIGENAIIAAGSIVTKNVAANTIVGGNPAKVIRKI